MGGKKKDVAMKRNWYKIATIALSAAMVVIMFVTGIYYKRHDSYAQKISRIEQEIDKLLSQKRNVERTPTISVTLLTLENSGLPLSAFSSLDAVPAVFRLEHVGGETAQGISISIKSHAKILEFLADETVEKFSHTLSEDGYRLRIDVPKLRRDSKLQGTIKCNRVSAMDAEVRIDNGITVQDLQSRAQAMKDLRYLAFDDLNRIDPRDFATAKQIESAIADLRDLIRRERGETKDKDDSVLSFLPAYIVFSTGLGVSLILIVYYVDRKKGKKGNELGNRIGMVFCDNLIRIGTTKTEIRDMIGLPKKMITLRDSQECSVQWLYEPDVTSAYGWQPDLTLTFKDDEVSHIEFKEYGERVYT